MAAVPDMGRGSKCCQDARMEDWEGPCPHGMGRDVSGVTMTAEKDDVAGLQRRAVSEVAVLGGGWLAFSRGTLAVTKVGGRVPPWG